MKPIITFLMSSAATAYGGSETYILNVAKNLVDNFNIKLINEPEKDIKEILKG